MKLLKGKPEKSAGHARPLFTWADNHCDDFQARQSSSVRDGVEYIVCCLDRLHNAFVIENVGFPRVLDGGGGIVLVVFEADRKEVVPIHCHGRA